MSETDGDAVVHIDGRAYVPYEVYRAEQQRADAYAKEIRAFTLFWDGLR